MMTLQYRQGCLFPVNACIWSEIGGDVGCRSQPFLMPFTIVSTNCTDLFTPAHFSVLTVGTGGILILSIWVFYGCNVNT